MDDESKAETKAIAFSMLKLSVEAMAGVLALSGMPFLASGLKLSAATATFAKDVTAKRNEKRFRRLESHVKYLSERVATVDKEANEETSDLFIDVLAKAVMDDEDRKAPFYDCVLEWILQGRPSPTAAQARIAAAAVEQLSYIELFAFVAVSSQLGGTKLPQEEGIPEAVWWNRLSAFGLSSGGSFRIGANATAIGDVLADYVDRDRLTIPKAFGGESIGKTKKLWGAQKG